MNWPVGIITVSDRAAGGVYPDLSGPALQSAVGGWGWVVTQTSVVPDEKPAIQKAIRDQMVQGCRLILTTGGTGIASRDVTPEALREIAACELPGFGETMRRESLRYTPNALLSRNLAVVVDRALVMALPGKPQAAVQCLACVREAVPHALDLLAGGQAGCGSPPNSDANLG